MIRVKAFEFNASGLGAAARRVNEWAAKAESAGISITSRALLAPGDGTGDVGILFVCDSGALAVSDEDSWFNQEYL